jgi:Nif-specific regulatory protein
MPSIEQEYTPASTAQATRTMSLRDRLESVEKEALEDALRTSGGNRAKAARLLSTTERIFNYRVRKYGIDWRKFRTRMRF